MLGVTLSFAFWITLLMIIFLAPLIFIAIIKDRKDVKTYGLRGNQELRKFAFFPFIYMSVRRKEKPAKIDKKPGSAQSKRTGVSDRDNNEQEGNNYQKMDDSQVDTLAPTPTHKFERQKTPVPEVSEFGDEDDDRDARKSFKLENKSMMNMSATHQRNGSFLDESNVKLNPTFEQEFDNLEEIKSESVSRNSVIMDKRGDADTGLISESDRSRLDTNLKKRSRKKRNRSSNRPNLFEEDKFDGRSEKTVNMSVASRSQYPASEDEEAPRINKKKLKKVKRRRTKAEPEKEVKIDNIDVEEMEGGENDKTDTYGGTTGNHFDTNENSYQMDGANFNDGLKVRKRKKKLLKKKKKKKPLNKNADDFDTLAAEYEEDADDDSPEATKDNNFKTNHLFKSNDLNSTNGGVQAQVVRKPGTAFSRPTSSESKYSNTKDITVVNEKAQERHYDGKFYCETLKYGHRFPSLVTFFNDRLPRFLRVLILYMCLFATMFFSGIFFFSKSDTNAVGDMGVGHCIGFAIVTVIFDWMVYMFFTFLFILKPFPERHNKYAENDETIDQGPQDEPDAVSENPSRVKIEKYEGPDRDEKAKSINKMTIIMACVLSGIILCFFWAFIIVMSSLYSQRAGQLWALTFLFTVIFDFIIVEFIVLHQSSKFIFKRKLDIRDKVKNSK